MVKNDEFFYKLCEDNYEKIFKYIIVMVHDIPVAQDLVQDVFLIAYNKRDVLINHENKTGFLYKVSKNLVYEYIRNRQKHKVIELDENLTSTEEDVYEFICKQEDLKIDESKYINELLDSLTKEKRQLYESYYIKKIPMKQIAKEMNLDESTVRMRFVRLRKDIKNRVKKLKMLHQ